MRNFENKTNKPVDDRPFRLRHPNFPFYASSISLLVSVIALIVRLYMG